MSKFRFELDCDGIRKNILQTGWMEEYIRKEAQNQAQSGDNVKPFIGYDRAKAIIYGDGNND